MQTVTNTKFSVSLTIIFCALLLQLPAARAQDVPPPDTTWDADPLDVLEPKTETPAEPTVPEFTEIPDPNSAPADVPAPEIAPPSYSEPAPTHADASSSFSDSGNSDPDYNKENYFHNIYKKYNQTPTSDEVWEKAVGERKSENYKVQKGNTLWDISNTFFGDPNFWPKLWSLNDGAILNPHEITPDMNIKFYPGTMIDAPTVALADKEGGEAAEGEKVVEASVAEPPVPPTRRKHTPVLKKLPQSLPFGRFGIYDDSTGTEIEFRKTNVPAPLEYLGYFVADSEIAGSGTVTATELDSKSANEYQIVYVELTGTPEKHYTVQKNVGKVVDPAAKKRKAQMVEIQGELEIMEKVNAEKNLYRAIVQKAIHSVEVGSVLIPGKVPMIDPRPGEINNSAGAKIMGGELIQKRAMFGVNELVFLDAGSARGFQEGQNLTIYADSALRNGNSKAVMNDRAIGSVKIIRVTPNFATAYVTKASEDVMLGDYVGNSSAKTASAAPVVESHAPESQGELDTEFELEGVPEAGTPPESGSEDLDLEL
ncbi:LysM peptidoglycan-binding domain-containing protein [Bdellovibrio sp. HCB274]|uniref:LysM peptidoglycan-binding domain-containing protein n=1 Tax=Bdellovibrio sp. HCB274 TaxID=3394361 RepID=UPI0039B4713C